MSQPTIDIGPLYGPAGSPGAGDADRSDSQAGNGPSLPPPVSPASGPSAAPNSPLSPVPPGSAAPAAPRPRERVEPLNLSRRPFVNSRPVIRATLVLYLLGLVLVVVTVLLFNRYLSSSRDTRTRLAAAESAVAGVRQKVQDLDKTVGGLRLAQQNREVAFLNSRIDERTFSWSLLLDRLSDVLPDGVRLLRLTPSPLAAVSPSRLEAEVRAGREPKPQPVGLAMDLDAKDDESIMRFVDNLFAHPAFSEPNLSAEQRLDTGLIRFQVTVRYQSQLPPRDTADALTGGNAAAPSRGTAATGAKTRPAGSAGADYPAGSDNPADAADPAAGVPRAASPAGSSLVRVAPPPRRPRPPAGSRTGGGGAPEDRP